MAGGRWQVVAPDEVDWDQVTGGPDGSVFAGQAWLEFLAAARGARPVTASLQLPGRDEPVGWFTGATARRGGVPQLGSPLRGWLTSYMGCHLAPGVDRAAAVAALAPLAFGPLGCWHLEVLDRDVGPALAAHLGRPWRWDVLPGWERELDGGDDDLLAGMTAHGRRDVRRADRNGLTAHEVDPATDPSFATDYQAMVTEAFAKRGATPPYGAATVQAAIDHLHPTGNLLLLRVRTADGEPAACGLFPGRAGGRAVFWLGASHLGRQRLLPTEALLWAALRAWRDRGATVFDFGGGGHHKAKYGGRPIEVAWLRASRWAALETARGLATRLAARRPAVAHRVARR